MSIVNMSRMSLVAHASERSKLLRIFLKSGCVEIVRSENVLLNDYMEDEHRRNQIDSKRLRISFALDFIKEITKQYNLIDKKNNLKINLKKDNRLVNLDEYYLIPKHEMDINGYISEMEKINSALVDIKGEKSRNNALIEQLQVFDLVDTPFNKINDTKTSSVKLGVVPINNVQNVIEKLKDIAVVENYDKDKQSAIIVICHKDNLKETNDVLSENEFVSANFNYKVTAAEKIAEIEEKNNQLDEKRKTFIVQGSEYTNYLSELKVAYDYYLLELTKMKSMSNCPKTGKAFVLEAWLPTEKVESIEKLIKNKCKYVEVAFREPFEDEQPPTLTKNNKFVSAFDGLTEMYGAPNYREGDPNIFVAMFYFLFFGIMISDAGYGLLIAMFCFLTVILTKPVKNSGKMLIMFGWCGISTVIWGALFGGWFGITPTTSFLAKFVWFSPLDEPLKMFMLALGMGVLQIGVGFALNGVEEIKKGKIVGGILNNFTWDIILLGLVLLSPNLMVFLGAINPDPVPAVFGTLATIGKYTAVAGFVLLLIGGGVGKKNPIKMVTGAFGNAYGAINVVSDLLSYSRLFGLGLTTGVIGYVVNMLAKDIIVDTFFHGMWVGWIFAVIILLIGHLFNLAINFLGAYVHNSRLQYIEFFGRFYEGSGHAFDPIGSKTKYTYLDN